MLETFKETIMKPMETEKIISSLTSVENDCPSMPNPSQNEIEPPNENEEPKHSLPSIKEIKKQSSKVEENSSSKAKSRNNVQKVDSLRDALTRKITDAV